MNKVEITPEMINCMGCRSDELKTPFCESMCEIRKCVTKKGYDTCAQCKDIDNCETSKFILSNNDEARNNLMEIEAYQV